MILVYGGSFNPPTKAHYEIAKYFIERNLCDKFIFLPVGDYYDKNDLVHSKHRIEMLNIIKNILNNVEISDYEVKLDRFIGTVNILDMFSDIYKTNSIGFVCGADNLLSIEDWVESERLLENYQIYVLNRNEIDLEEFISQNTKLNKYKNNIYIINDIRKMNVSASQYRDSNEYDKFVLDEVNEYIYNHNLYNRKK